MNNKIKFGWRIPDFPLDRTRGHTFTQQIVSVLDEIHEYFNSAWEADHFIPWAGFQDPTTDTMEAWTTIAYLAGRYTDLQFGNIVLCQSYRSPALLAKMAATLHTFTNGRLVVSIGAGWKGDEYKAYGYEFPSLSVRFEQLEETAQILRLMWSKPHATFHGKHYHIENAICEPKPMPHLPLMIGGGGKKKTLRITAQYADWWNFPGGSVEHYEELLGVLRGHCAVVGRNYDQIVKTWATDCVAIAPTREIALKIAQANPLYDPATSVVGTPDDVTAHLQRFVNLGVQHFILRFADFPKKDGARLFTDEVIPRFIK
jgi:alkanesulfonate monooxygenase SsuD/methylene tetrahydromethanopterin reductase-like flavin-dependent oxidoreductase (luciferase family)